MYWYHSSTDTPGKPDILDVTKNTVSLTWSRPKNDGGSKIVGYYVEAMKLPGDKWVRCNTSSQNVPREEYTVSGLEEDMQYQFRVIAKTTVNMSKPSDPTDPVLVSAENGKRTAVNLCVLGKAQLNTSQNILIVALNHDFKLMFLFTPVPPRIELGVKMQKLLPIKAGSCITLEAEVFGKPMPKVTWKRNNESLKSSEKIKMSQKRHLFQMELSGLTKEHTGVYTILAENASGSKTGEIQLTVLGK